MAHIRCWFLGCLDGYASGGELGMGITFDNDPTSSRSVAYDRGATVGERCARAIAMKGVRR